MLGPLGLIAGRGNFPRELARSVRARGRIIAAVGFHGETDPGLESDVDTLTWVRLGELDGLIQGLHGAGVREAVMVGKISKRHLYRASAELRPDARFLAVLAGLRDRMDDSILGALADTLEGEGIHLLPQAEVAPELFAGEGVLGACRPTSAQWADIAFAWPVAKAISGLDIGQTLVVRDGAVLAVEAIEGTDAAIARGGELAGGGAVVVKVAKLRQDPRFDLPGIGLDTLTALVNVKASVLAFEARRTVVLERDELVRRADSHGIVLIGIPEDGPKESA